MSRARVIVSGAGVAGTVLAYWLGKYNFEVVVVERSSLKTQQGQIIDVEGPAEKIVAKMGLLDEIKEKSTHEAGFSFVDASNRAVGTLPAGASGATKEIEIMRPNLVAILLHAAKSLDRIEFRYGHTIKRVQQNGSSVTVDIENRADESTSTETFDFLVICDGLRSTTRDMVLPEAERSSCLKPLNVSVAFFNIPAEPQDRPYARCYLAPGRRNASLKPFTEKLTSTYLCLAKYDQQLHEARESRDLGRQKKAIAALFKGSGWECDRLVKGMMETDNFYFEELCQVRLEKWSRGRCVLLGDTAYAPSPLTGQGTNMAILGAYVLASKLVKQPQDPERAFAEYERDYRPYVNKVQPIPVAGYAPLLLNPETAWGIWLVRQIVSWAAWLQPWKYLPSINVVPYDLPDL